MIRAVSYGQLLQIFFSVVTDPTTLNYQGNDYGESYRSALFYMNAEQQKAGEAYSRSSIREGVSEQDCHRGDGLSNFYAAEDYHQDNAFTNEGQPRLSRLFRPAQDRGYEEILSGAVG